MNNNPLDNSIIYDIKKSNERTNRINNILIITIAIIIILIIIIIILKYIYLYRPILNINNKVSNTILKTNSTIDNINKILDDLFGLSEDIDNVSSNIISNINSESDAYLTNFCNTFQKIPGSIGFLVSPIIGYVCEEAIL